MTQKEIITLARDERAMALLQDIANISCMVSMNPSERKAKVAEIMARAKEIEEIMTIDMMFA